MIPFDYSLFYNAMVGLIGRIPSTMIRYGSVGFYDFVYIPENDTERRIFLEHVETIRRWLSYFDVQTQDSKTRCEFVETEFGQCLRITVYTADYKGQ